MLPFNFLSCPFRSLILYSVAVSENIVPLIAYTYSLQSNAMYPVFEADQTTETTRYPLYQRDIYGSRALIRIKLLKWLTLRKKGEDLFLSLSANRSYKAGAATNLHLSIFAMTRYLR